MKLFPRRCGRSPAQIVKWRAMAHRILDRWQAGDEIRPDLVDWALRITGDAA